MGCDIKLSAARFQSASFLSDTKGTFGIPGCNARCLGLLETIQYSSSISASE